MNAFLHFLVFAICAFFIIAALSFIFLLLRIEGHHWLNEYRKNKKDNDRLSPEAIERIRRDLQRNRQDD